MHLSSLSSAGVLTSLVGADGDGSHRPGEGAELRHAVLGLDLEGVVGMGGEVQHGDGGVGEALRAGHEAQLPPTQLTLLQAGPAALAQDIVGQVLPPSRVTGRAPLQEQRGLIDVEDHISRGRWRPYG